MEIILSVLNLVVLAASSIFFFILAFSSYREKEIRAACISLASMIVNGVIWAVFLSGIEALTPINIIVLFFLGGFGLISVLPFFPGKSGGRDLSAIEPYDERDNMFARNNIQHHPDLMEKYYQMRPANRTIDQQIHAKPEFGEKAQLFHDAYTAPCYEAAFEFLERSIPLSNGETAPEKKPIDKETFCATIAEFAKFYGACDVSFVKLKDHHFYSRKGRHAHHWGDPTDREYDTGIVIAVPMRVNMIKKGPTSTVLQESAQKYVEAAKISNILAGYIRMFGYRARAHNDANYDTLCVPAAVESGMGELGRMGILMHRVHGPCIRLALVTTELSLPESESGRPMFMGEFCKICKKCADNCPSGSITHGDEPVSRNVRHWSIKQEQCFSYWKTIGSDCGLCIAVCPYTKPDTLIHKFVRLYISRNIVNQKIALFMDDLLYGRQKELPKTNPKKIFDS